MLITNCPACHDPIRLPNEATTESKAKCPWCGEVFSLAEVFEKLPPEVEIIEGPGSLSSSESKQANQPLLFLQDGPNTSESTADSKSASAPMAKIERRPRRPSKEPNGALEFVKIILGGMAGCVIAVLIVWYGLRRDVGGLATQLPAWTYVVVPHEIWTPEMQAAATAAGRNPEKNSPESEQNNPPGNPSDINIEVIGDNNPTDPANTINTKPKSLVQENKNQEGQKTPQLTEEPMKDTENSDTINSNNENETDPSPINSDQSNGNGNQPEVVETITDFQSKVDPKVSTMIKAINADLGPIGAEIPTFEEVEAFETSGEIKKD